MSLGSIDLTNCSLDSNSSCDITEANSVMILNFSCRNKASLSPCIWVGEGYNI